MNSETVTIILVLLVLVMFLSFITILKYAIADNFIRTRLIMTSFLAFIVMTLTISFWRYALDSLYFTVPAMFVGVYLGHTIGVTTERQKIAAKGVAHYVEHFHHISKEDLKSFTWWSIVNFYSIMGGLVLINLVGLSTFIFPQHQAIAIATTVVGALLIGTLIPYIIHLWSVDHERL
jgi:hypothetical protein